MTAPLDSVFETILLHAQADGLRRLIVAAQLKLSQIEAQAGLETIVEPDPFQTGASSGPNGKRVLSKTHREAISSAQRRRWEDTKAQSAEKGDGPNISDIEIASVDTLLEKM